MKLANASSGRSVNDNVLEPDQRDFSGNIEGLQMMASRRINSRTDLNRIDETPGNFTVEEGDLLVNERNIDRQTHIHHGDTRSNAKADSLPASVDDQLKLVSIGHN